jgi:hypothetical protein
VNKRGGEGGALVVVGMLTLDTLLAVGESSLAVGGVVPVSNATQCVGGKGFVAAVAMASCGLFPELLALTSADVDSSKHDLRGVNVSPELRLLGRPSSTWSLLQLGEDITTLVHETRLAKDRIELCRARVQNALRKA